MSNFREFQKSFCSFVQKDGSLDSCLDDIIPVGKLSVEKVLRVYQDDFNARLSEALGTSYETTWGVIGDELFLDLCRRYIKMYPSAYYSLGHYGENFGALLDSEGVNEDIPFASELANFEWVFWQVFHSEKPKERPGLEYINTILQEGSPLLFSSEVKIFNFNHSIGRLWREKSDLENCSVEDFLKPESLAIARSNDGVMLLELDKEQYDLVESLMKKGSWDEGIEELDFLESWDQEQWASFFKILIQLIVKE